MGDDERQRGLGRGLACPAAARLGVAAVALSLAALAGPARAASVAPSTAAPPVAPGRMSLSLVRVGGSPPFALVRQHIAVRGTVIPYVAGQRVKVSIYRQGRKIVVSVLAIRPGPKAGTGTFAFSFVSSRPGAIDIRAAHYADPEQGLFTARAPTVTYTGTELGPGASGQSVRLLQSELATLHYAVPFSGVFDEGTGQALIAYRKMTGLERIPYAGRTVFSLLARRAGAFHVRDIRDGRHVEADLTRQVLAEIEPRGRVREIYDMSSGKPSTPTVVGHFRVYRKEPGANSEDMVDSNYFISGYAIHGYPEVPTYAASHGCLRIPIPDAPAVFAWVHEGTPVDVYDEGGGGSGAVRSNAGP
jgi:L,D-transpeptidase catalytic domain